MTGNNCKIGLGCVYAFCKGRTTTFAVFFTLAGTGLAIFGKLTPTYVALIGAIQALAFAHSVKEDYHERKMNGNGEKS